MVGQSEVDNEERDDEIRLVAVKMVQPEPAILVIPDIDHLILRLTTYRPPSRYTDLLPLPLHCGLCLANG